MLELVQPKAVHEPPTSLSPGQILQMSLKECGVWSELLPPEAQSRFAVFAASIDALSKATSVHDVEAAINIIGHGCLAAEDARAEFARRAAWLEELSKVQEEFESIRAAKESEVRGIADLIKFDSNTPERQREKQKIERELCALSEHIDALAGIRWAAQADLNAIDIYLRAVDTVNKGWPEHLKKEAMPAIPEFIEQATASEQKTEAVVPALSVAQHSAADPEKALMLDSLAERYGLFKIEVLVYTLFECLHSIGKRGLKRALTVAHELGLNGALGMPGTVDELLPGSGWSDTGPESVVSQHGYLEYRGSPVEGSPTYVRSEKPLPWDVHALIPEEKAAEFLRTMGQKSQRKSAE